MNRYKMGIKDLYPFLKEKFGIEGFITDVSIFKGYGIGVDVNNLAYKFMFGAINSKLDVYYLHKDRKVIFEKWKEMFISFNNRIVEAGVNITYVFDGINIPKDKETTQFERWTKRKKNKDRVENDEKFNENASKLKKELGNNVENDTMIIQGYKASIDDLKNDVRIEKEEMWALRDMMRDKNFNVMINDTMEAEEYLTLLCKKGTIGAVYSEDGDLIAYRCPIIIRQIEGTKCNIWTMKTICKTLDLTEDQLIMFCVLLGTDYNERIKGIKLGPVNGYKLIKTIQTIDELKSYFETKNIDYSSLNLDRTFQRFKNIN